MLKTWGATLWSTLIPLACSIHRRTEPCFIKFWLAEQLLEHQFHVPRLPAGALQRHWTHHIMQSSLFSKLKAAHAFYVAHHAASVKAGMDISGPTVRWFVPFAMMLDMVGVDIPGGLKGILVGNFERLVFDGRLPISGSKPWEVSSASSTGTPTVLLAEALIPQKTTPSTTPSKPQKINTCTWGQEMKGTYIPGCSNNCKAFKLLLDAQAACAAEPTCGGVTYST